MTMIPDLEVYGREPEIAVGWLGSESVFERGAVPEEFFQKLKSLCRAPWEPYIAMGFHVCELCQYEGATGKANLFVPHANRIYIAPVMIVHYIAAHWYRPPEVFIEAVMACPEMNSMDYKKALLANGGREWMKSMLE